MMRVSSNPENERCREWEPTNAALLAQGTKGPQTSRGRP